MLPSSKHNSQEGACWKWNRDGMTVKSIGWGLISQAGSRRKEEGAAWIVNVKTKEYPKSEMLYSWARCRAKSGSCCLVYHLADEDQTKKKNNLIIYFGRILYTLIKNYTVLH